MSHPNIIWLREEVISGECVDAISITEEKALEAMTPLPFVNAAARKDIVCDDIVQADTFSGKANERIGYEFVIDDRFRFNYVMVINIICNLYILTFDMKTCICL